jgi:hypothetical protein
MYQCVHATVTILYYSINLSFTNHHCASHSNGHNVCRNRSLAILATECQEISIHGVKFLVVTMRAVKFGVFDISAYFYHGD